MNSNFWARNRRKLLLTAVATAGVGCAAYYVYSKYRQVVDEVNAILNSTSLGDPTALPRSTAGAGPGPSSRQNPASSASNHPDNDKQGRTTSSAEHLDSIQTIAERATLPSLLPQLKLRIWALTDLDRISAELRALRAGGRGGDEQSEAAAAARKYQLWRELNVESFTRALAVSWALPMLGVFIKVQLTILARALRESSSPTRAATRAAGAAKSDTADPAPPGSPDSPLEAHGDAGAAAAPRGEFPVEAQQRFIALADYFCTEGVAAVVREARASAEMLVGPRDLKSEVTAESLSDLLTALWYDFAARAAGRGWGRGAYLLPEEGEVGVADGLEGADREALESLVQQCHDAVASRPFDRALRAASRCLLDVAASVAIAGAFGPGAAALAASTDLSAAAAADEEPAVLFAKAVPSVAASVRGLADGSGPGHEAALVPALQVDEVRAMLGGIWAARGG